MRRGVERLLRGVAPAPLTVLDLGAGLGGAAPVVRDAASAMGHDASCIAVDIEPSLARIAASREGCGLCATALALPFADASVDLTVGALLLHHLDDDAGLQLLREALRVSRIGVVIADLRRSRLGAAGLWLASYPLGFHPVSRHDGVVSLLRGFTAGELDSRLRAAGGHDTRVTKCAAYRLVATCRARHVPPRLPRQ
jgi:SAM-dependent methyltransferase